LRRDPLADRFAAFELPPWQDDTAFAQLLKTFAAILPLRSPSELCQPKIRQRLLSLTGGVTVRLCRVLEAAAMAAITTGSESIGLATLSDELGERSHLGAREQAAIFDYGAPKLWRSAMARMARVPERWVWALDLQQRFPAVGCEWFLHHPARPEHIVSGFCPDCFREQIARGQTLHLKAQWSAALVTRCFEHQLPLDYFCPWCGRDDPVHFPENRACFRNSAIVFRKRPLRLPLSMVKTTVIVKPASELPEEDHTRWYCCFTCGTPVGRRPSFP
jgi:hypothetical protein